MASASPYDVRSMFARCDVHGRGRLDSKDFAAVCRELGLDEAQVPTLFARLDRDGDGVISYEDFANGFQVASDVLADEPGAGDDQPGGSWTTVLQSEETTKDLYEQFGDCSRYLSNWDQLSEVHKQLMLSEDKNLVRTYEEIVNALLHDAKHRHSVVAHLEHDLKKSEDRIALTVSEMESEVEDKISAVEERARTEERSQAKTEQAELKQFYDDEILNLQSAIEKLLKLKKEPENDMKHEQMATLQNKVDDMIEENRELRRHLLDSKTNMAVIESELITTKSELTSQNVALEREQMLLRQYSEDRHDLAGKIEVLDFARRQLNDSNDELRAVVEQSCRSNRGSQVSSPDRRHRRPRSVSPQPDYLRVRPSSPCSLHSSSPHMDHNSWGRSRATLDLPDGLRSGHSCPDILSQEDDTGPVLRDVPDGLEGDHQARICGLHSSDDFPPVEDEDVDHRLKEIRDVWKPAHPSHHCGSTTSPRLPIHAFLPTQDALHSGSSAAKVFKIVLTGDASVGKSSFLTRLCKNEFDENCCTTLGVDFRLKKLMVCGEEMVLQLWDTAGQERFRSIAKSYFRRAQGVLLLYDVMSERSFLDVRQWLDDIKISAESEIPIMIVGNKTDLRKKMDDADIPTMKKNYISSADGERLAMMYNSLFCETSAKDGSNVVEATLHLARDVRKFAEIQEVQSLALMNPEKKQDLTPCCNN
uniref:ras and EF-hand domain-containing protein homolog isoform X2 n=1 Tax=Myxine glutinosa TaxID=7769 RepID=UPI00358EA925